MQRFLKLLGVNISVLCFFLIVLEGVMRLVDYGPGTQPLDSDPILHHVHPNDYSYTVYDPLYGEYGGHQIHYDHTGIRVASKHIQADKSIWFIGDSFTEAMQHDYDSTFVGRVQSEVEGQYICKNFGNASYSPLIHYIILSKELRTEKPDYVIIQVYSNDVSDDNMYVKLATYKDNVPIACNGGKANTLISKVRKSYLARNLRRIYWTLKYINFNRNGKLSFRNHVEHSPKIEAKSEFARNVLLIDSLLNIYQIDHYFLAIPSKYACYSNDWESNSFDKTFNSFAWNNNLSYIDATDKFKKQKDASNGFFFKDIHLTSLGNRWISETILEKLEDL